MSARHAVGASSQGWAILGSAQVLCAALPTLDASSALGLDVTRWAARPARLARMDRLCALALVACDGALVDAALSPEGADWTPARTGIVVGSAFGCHATNETYYRSFLSSGVEGASPRLFAYTLPSSPVGEITIHHKILGPASTAVGGLTAAIDAVREALRHLLADRADRMLVAGVDVSTPMLARLGQPAHHDAAAALVLGRGERGDARITATSSRYSDRDPAGAAARAMTELLAQRRDDAPLRVERLVAPRALLPVLGALLPGAEPVALDERLASAAPLVALRAALSEGERGATLVVGADPVGQAAAMLLER